MCMHIYLKGSLSCWFTRKHRGSALICVFWSAQIHFHFPKLGPNLLPTWDRSPSLIWQGPASWLKPVGPIFQTCNQLSPSETAGALKPEWSVSFSVGYRLDSVLPRLEVYPPGDQKVAVSVFLWGHTLSISFSNQVFYNLLSCKYKRSLDLAVLSATNAVETPSMAGTVTKWH